MHGLPLTETICLDFTLISHGFQGFRHFYKVDFNPKFKLKYLILYFIALLGLAFQLHFKDCSWLEEIHAYV